MKDLSNFANIGVNSIITDKERLTESMRKFLYDRVWSDDSLLGGFTYQEIDEIISRTLDRDFSTISQFLAVLLEDEANEYMKEHGMQKYNNVCTQMSPFNKLAVKHINQLKNKLTMSKEPYKYFPQT